MERRNLVYCKDYDTNPSEIRANREMTRLGGFLERMDPGVKQPQSGGHVCTTSDFRREPC